LKGPTEPQDPSHKSAIYRFIKRYRVLEMPAGWLSRVVLLAPESSLVRSILGPPRDRLRGAMKLEEVLEVLRALEAHDIPLCLAGGWGVDALVGRQTRSHDDLDVVIDNYEHEVPRDVDALAPLGFRLRESYERPVFMNRITVLEDDRGRLMDLNSLDWRKLAEKAGPLGADGATPDALRHHVISEGTLGGRRVPCLSADVQLLFHAGFDLSLPQQLDVRMLRDKAESSAPKPPVT